MSDRTLEEINADLQAADQELHAAAQRREELMDEQMRVRTASYDPSVVATARGLGINPDNFDSQQLLQEAIDKVNNQNNEETQ